MLLQDFAAQRGVKADTVRAYIREHKDEFNGHTSMDGKQKVLDAVAIELLDAKYPLPKPIQVIQDTEAREQLAVALRELADARGRIGEIYGQLLDAQARAHQAQLAAARVDLLEAAAADREARIQQTTAELLAAQETSLQAQAAQRAAELAAEELRAALKEREAALAAEAAARAEAEAALQAERSKTWLQRLLGR